MKTLNRNKKQKKLLISGAIFGLMLLLASQSAKADKISDTWQDVNVHGALYYRNVYSSEKPFGDGFYTSDGTPDTSRAKTKVELDMNITSGEYNGWQATSTVKFVDEFSTKLQTSDNSNDLFIRYFYVTKDFGKGQTSKISALKTLVVSGGKQYMGSPFEDDLATGIKVDYRLGNFLMRAAYYGNTGYGSENSKDDGSTDASIDTTYVAFGYGDVSGYRNEKLPFLVNIWGLFGTNSDKTNDLYGCSPTALACDPVAVDPTTDNYGGLPGAQNPTMFMANIGFNTKHFGFRGQYAYANYGGHVDNDYGSSVTYGERGGIELSAYIDNHTKFDIGWVASGKSGKVSYDNTDAGIVDNENALLGENFVTYATEDNANYVWIRYRGQFFENKLHIQLSYIYQVSKYDPENMVGNAVYVSSGSATRYANSQYELLGFISYRINKRIEVSDIVSYTGFDVADNYKNLINNDTTLDSNLKKNYISSTEKADNGIVFNQFQVTYFF